MFSESKRKALYAGVYAGFPVFFRNTADKLSFYYLSLFLRRKMEEGFSVEKDGSVFFWFTRKDTQEFKEARFNAAFPGGFGQLASWLKGYGRKSLFRVEWKHRKDFAGFSFLVDGKSRNRRKYNYKDDVMMFLSLRQWKFMSEEVVQTDNYMKWTFAAKSGAEGSSLFKA